MSFSALHINVKIRIIVGFFQKVVNQMIIPFMTIYFASKLGAKLAGLFMVIITLSGLFFIFYGGYISDLKGRKPLLLITEFGNFIVFFLMALCNSYWYTSAFLTFLLFFINNGLTNLSKPALDAMIIDVSTPKTRKFIYSINYWTNNLSFGIGAMVGAFFYKRYFFEVLLFASIFTLCIFLIYFFFITESKPRQEGHLKRESNNEIKSIISGYKYVVKDNIFLRFFLVSITIMTIEYQLSNFISVRLVEEFGEASPFKFLGVNTLISGIEMYGILRAENNIGVVILALFLERILKRLPDQLRLYIGTIIFTLGYVVLGSSNLFWLLVTAMLLLTMGELTFVPVQQAILSIIVDENMRTKYIALYGLSQRIGMVVASLFISIGSVVPSFIISILYGFLGITSLILYSSIIKHCKYFKKVDEIAS